MHVKISYRSKKETCLDHLIRLIDVEDESRGLADDKQDHDGEEEGGHGLVPPVPGAQGVVHSRVATIINRLKWCEKLPVSSKKGLTLV